MDGEFGVRLLGPVELGGGDGGLRPGGAQLRLVLGLLALSAGRVVPVADLAEALWAQRPPTSAQASVQILITRLRRLLAGVPGWGIDRYGKGYRLQVSRDLVDVHRFRSQVRSARQCNDDEQAAAVFGQALGLWRGPALADVAGTPRVEAIRAGLAEERLSAVQDRFGRLLAAGRHEEAAAEIQLELVGHPMAEPLSAMLMTAWYRCGRPAEALQVFRDLRGLLTDELGVEPGAPLQRLHQQILTADPALAAPDPLRIVNGRRARTSGDGEPRAEPEPEPREHEQKPTPRYHRPERLPVNGKARTRSVRITTALAVPRQLPAAPVDFAGRRHELRSLTELTEAGADGSPVTVTISGTPGVGKTALALQWAHQATQRFADGQLYVNLCGFDSSLAPVTPAEAIAGFLESLGVPAGQIPSRPGARAALYRSLLAGKRMIVILDNARDEAQVRPLLPGSPTCLVLVTSRNELTGLVATQGARPVGLDVLTDPEARQLLASRLGTARITAEADAASELISLCGHLPLALAIAAARAATRPALPLASLAGTLRDIGHRLDGLNAGDEAADVKAVFSWSCRLLSEPAARMFRLLGVHPGPDIAAGAAASLAAVPAAAAGLALAELVRVGLVHEPVPGRFTLHDLLRAYASELASQTERRTGLRRVLDYYLHTAHGAVGLAYPAASQIAVTPPGPGTAPQLMAGPDQALAWLRAEHHVLLSAAAAAARGGLDVYAWQLPAVLREYFARRCHYQDWAQSQQEALAAAARLADDAAQALTHRSLGEVHIQLSSWPDARSHLQQALTLYQKLGDHAGQADCHYGMGHLSSAQGDHAAALRHDQRALRLYRAAEDQTGQAVALNAVGWCHALLGNNQRALSYCTRALSLHRATGNRFGEAVTLCSLGYSHHQAGRHSQAVALYKQALAAWADAGDHYYRAHTLIGLGDTHRAAGDPRAARDAWQQAAGILDDLRHPDARSVRAKLERLATDCQ